MRKLKIYLQYPWKYPDSPYYKYLLQNTLDEIEYLNTKKQKGVLTSSKKLFFSHEFKRTIRRFIRILKIPILNAHLTKTTNYDLIHCAHCLSKNKNKPWIADFEGLWQIYFENRTRSLKRKLRKIFLRNNCKKILPWSNAVKKDILREFSELENKTEVVYPAFPVSKIKRKKHKEINLLFSGRYFFRKGGLHALEAISRLTQKHKNVYGHVISDVPENLLKRYSKNKKIKIYNLMPQEKFFELMSKSDVHVYPGYRDSFGFPFIECMSFGIPSVTVKGFARDEIITEGKTGFIINKIISKPEMRKHHEEVVQELIKTTEKLIKNKKLREKMSKNCIEEIKNGKFSIKERNKKLKKIYFDALK